MTVRIRGNEMNNPNCYTDTADELRRNSGADPSCWEGMTTYCSHCAQPMMGRARHAPAFCADCQVLVDMIHERDGIIAELRGE